MTGVGLSGASGGRFRARLRSLEAVVALSTWGLAVHLMPSPWVMRMVKQAARQDGAPETGVGREGTLGASSEGLLTEATQAKVEAVRAALGSAQRFVPGVTCLVSTMAGWGMLRFRSVRSRVVLDVAIVEGVLLPHAWLEVAGSGLIGRRGSGVRLEL